MVSTILIRALTAAVAFAGLAIASPAPLALSDTDVTDTAVGIKVALAATNVPGTITAAVTNKGTSDLVILKVNSIFYDADIQRVSVSKPDGLLPIPMLPCHHPAESG